MLIIGELLNGMFKKIGEAIRTRDESVIQACALTQIESGAHVLDVNCGAASPRPLDDMLWLVSVIQSVADVRLCIDSSNPAVIEAALKTLRKPGIVNSTTADDDKLGVLVPLAKQYGAQLIGIAISEAGIPQNKEQRTECAARIVTFCMENGFPVDRLLLDPVVMPLNHAQSQMRDILESIREFKLLADPAPRTVIGLSNVSQGGCGRKLINRTFLAMALAHGLDAAILDPTDKDLADTLITTELIMNQHIYCDSYLDAYRKR